MNEIIAKTKRFCLKSSESVTETHEYVVCVCAHQTISNMHRKLICYGALNKAPWTSNGSKVVTTDLNNQRSESSRNPFVGIEIVDGENLITS
jgi:hypothetical protein